MSENYALQASFKTPSGTLINLRAADEEELSAHLDTLGRQLAGVGEIEDLLAGMTNIFAGMSLKEKLEQDKAGTSGTPGSYQGGSAAPAASQAVSGGGRQCKHGEMVRREGTGARGPWVGWFCPTPKGSPDQCKAQFENNR